MYTLVQFKDHEAKSFDVT